jgi:hypothetical protein
MPAASALCCDHWRPVGRRCSERCHAAAFVPRTKTRGALPSGPCCVAAAAAERALEICPPCLRRRCWGGVAAVTAARSLRTAPAPACSHSTPCLSAPSSSSSSSSSEPCQVAATTTTTTTTTKRQARCSRRGPPSGTAHDVEAATAWSPWQWCARLAQLRHGCCPVARTGPPSAAAEACHSNQSTRRRRPRWSCQPAAACVGPLQAALPAPRAPSSLRGAAAPMNRCRVPSLAVAASAACSWSAASLCPQLGCYPRRAPSPLNAERGGRLWHSRRRRCHPVGCS